MPGERCLVVEDQPDLRAHLTMNLEKSGYEVDVVESGEQALDLCKERAPDVILLDVQLPGIDGHKTASLIREFSDAAILMLTSNDSAADRVAALSTVADDYVTKGVSDAEIVARVQALCRRASTGNLTPTERLAAGNVMINLNTRVIEVADKPVRLTRIEFDLIACLAQAMPSPLSKEELIEACWGASDGASRHTVNVHMHNLKRKLSEAGAKDIELEAIRGFGFRLIDERIIELP